MLQNLQLSERQSPSGCTARWPQPSVHSGADHLTSPPSLPSLYILSRIKKRNEHFPSLKTNWQCHKSGCVLQGECGAGQSQAVGDWALEDCSSRQSLCGLEAGSRRADPAGGSDGGGGTALAAQVPPSRFQVLGRQSSQPGPPTPSALQGSSKLAEQASLTKTLLILSSCCSFAQCIASIM